ncbi:hypothetical protein Bca52824_020554 [Brassica carinata]|uniref:Peroxisome biogenesis protein 22 n=1 Tax=Brassica carinata TaxID=52824 RepID=A0A8X7VUH9_BRACI|nr:hypothetical protein Bca52824_020554 [Brassica carinata]
MAESSSSSSSPTEEIVRLIKRLSGYVAFKMSSLFSTPIRNLDSRSVGAIAGLAIAVIFTWRAIRTQPGEPQRRRPKRRMQSAESSSAAASIPPDVSSPHEDNGVQDVVDQFFQAGKPTLGQIVRQRLSEGRKVTCRLLGVILEESSPEELQVVNISFDNSCEYLHFIVCNLTQANLYAETSNSEAIRCGSSPRDYKVL